MPYRAARIHRLVPLLAALLLAGCTTTAVEVQGEFPTGAVVEKLPLSMGVLFTEEFRAYTLAEPIPTRGDWTIDIGSAQVAMFQSVLPAMFERVEEVDSVEAAEGLDAVLVPRVEEMQFAIPFQTKSNFFEVWIRYQLTLHDPATDTVIAAWPLTAYGRTRDAMLEGAEPAIRQAAIMALRDAGAFLAIDFRKTRELEPWLRQALPAGPDDDGTTAAAPAATPETGE
jgi:hypothetical protein